MKNLNITLSLTLALLLFPIVANCLTVTGRVLDDTREPFPGVTVIVKGTTTGTVTDFDGEFTIEAELNNVLVFSSVGMQKEELIVTSSNVGDIVLLPDLADLEEVVVVGYGYSSSSSKTGTSIVSSIKKNRKKKSTPKPKVMDVLESEPMSSGSVESPSAGLLTAGEVNDFSKWELWNDKSQDELRIHQNIWKISPAERFTVMVQNEAGFPMVGERVILLDKEKNTVWSAVTDNVGKAELWSNMFEKKYGKKSEFSIILNSEGQTYTIDEAKPFKEGVNHITISKGCDVSKVVDVVFVVDATGSMGDEIEYLKLELDDVIKKIKKEHKNLELNLGCVFYRDHNEEYVVKSSDLSGNVSQTIDFIKKNSAAGGGDTPEAIDEALKLAVNDLSWSSDSRTRIIFTLLDAPPHQDEKNIQMVQQAAYKAAEKGIKIVPIAASGIDKSGEYLLRSLALCTNGTYVFLTDDSGIGDSHIKPTTDTFKVETLNDIFIRLFYQFTNVVSCDEKELAKVEVDTVVVIENKIPVGEKPEEKLGETDIDSSDVNGDDSNNNPDDDKPIIEEEFTCSFYPNPTSGILNIDITGDVNELFLTDISGKLLQRFDVKGEEKLQINISHYPRGIYLVAYFGNNDKPKTGKIVLNK